MVLGQPTGTPVCSMRSLEKRYGGVVALSGVDLDIYPGTVHAITGENGAGKSTLMKILAGAVQPDSGSIKVAGISAHFSNIKESCAAGIAIVFQELNLFSDFDVVANLFFQRETVRWGLVRRDDMKRKALSVLNEIGFDESVDLRVRQLRLGQRQLVEIAKALLTAPRILILDEPNSALNSMESERLFSVIRRLKERGVAIIYISHRLEEVFAIADTITTMRDGSIVETRYISDTSIAEVVNLTTGGARSSYIRSRRHRQSLNDELRLEGVSVGQQLSNVTIRATSGEVVGIAGLEGSGVADVFKVLFGLRRIDGGSIQLPRGQPRPRSVGEAIRSGVALVPSDRQRLGLMMDRSIRDNVAVISYRSGRRARIWLNGRSLEIEAEELCKKLHVSYDTVHSAVASLSGGNQQKIVLGKWLVTDPQVLLLDDPTRGVDVGAKAEIYGIIEEVAEQGKIVLFTSSELPEFMHVCDRVIVFYQGRICGDVGVSELTEHALLHAMNTGRLS